MEILDSWISGFRCFSMHKAVNIQISQTANSSVFTVLCSIFIQKKDLEVDHAGG